MTILDLTLSDLPKVIVKVTEGLHLVKEPIKIYLTGRGGSTDL